MFSLGSPTLPSDEGVSDEKRWTTFIGVCARSIEGGAPAWRATSWPRLREGSELGTRRSFTDGSGLLRRVDRSIRSASRNVTSLGWRPPRFVELFPMTSSTDMDVFEWTATFLPYLISIASRAY
jgi:hypothetical protein